MYKNLNAKLLGITGRQSELIELALTYGFKGIDIDIVDMVKRCQRSSFENAARFLSSSKLRIGGFDAPIDLDGDDDAYAAKLAQMNGVAEIAQRAEASTAILHVPTGTDRLPYPEYFEVVRKRIDEIAEVFAKENVRVALAFQAIPTSTEEKQFKFIRDVEGFLALLKACSSKNVSIVFDTWNWFIGGGTEEHLGQIELERVAAIRISDCVEGVDRAAATYDDCLLPSSTNVIDNAGYLKKFAELEMKLPVTACGRPAEKGATRDALVGLTQDSLDQTFEAAGIPTTTRKPEMFIAASYSHYSNNAE